MVCALLWMGLQRRESKANFAVMAWEFDGEDHKNVEAPNDGRNICPIEDFSLEVLWEAKIVQLL